MIILHFALKNEWESHSLNEENILQCYNPSNIEQIDLELSTLKDYVILCIDENKVTSKITYETVPGTTITEPMINGSLNKEAVINVIPFHFDINDKFVVTDEIKDLAIINEVCDALKIEYSSQKIFNDGTSSRIILLNNEYLIKKANPQTLKACVEFSHFYNLPMFQKEIYHNENYDYAVFEYIPGDVMHTVSDFADLSDNIIKITSSYKKYDFEGYGYLDSKVSSWEEFLNEEIKNSSLLLPEIDYMLDDIYSQIEILSKYPFEKMLIHGDFGTHNFIKKDEKFVAAIDANPIVGDKLYDILFAFVSNVDLIAHLSIDYLSEITKEPREKITALLKIILYSRICRSAKYNKELVDTYLDFYEKLF